MGRHRVFNDLDSCINENFNLESRNYSTRQHVIGQTRKRIKIERELVPCVFAHLCSTLGKDSRTVLRTLLDSGASSSIISEAFAKKLKIKDALQVEWTTAAGTFSTNKKARVEFRLPELSATADVKCSVYVHKGSLGAYDMILG